MSGAAAVGLPLRIGPRTLLSIPRRLQRVSATLADVLAGRAPALPPLAPDSDGWWVGSVPDALVGTLGGPGTVGRVRQRYRRYRTDLHVGHEAWLAGMSGDARSALRRKERRLAGAVVRRYATPAELADAYALARPLSAVTYQERLLDAGLPDSPGFLGQQQALAARDGVRAWILFADGRPAAYLWCGAQRDALRYDFVGHDPALAALSPGLVLHAAAMRDLLAERRFRWFDFLEGEGRHKRRFATGSSPCADLLLLRATAANRAALAALAAFDGAVACAKRWAAHPALAGAARRVARG